METVKSYVAKKRDKKAAWSSWKKLCVGMDRPTRSLQIGYGPAVQQLKNFAMQINKLLGDGQTSERRIQTYPFDDEKGPFFGLGACIVYKSSPQSMPRFTIISTHRGHSQNTPHSSLTVMLLYLSGVHCWSHRKGSRPQYWCLRSFVWQHRGNCYPLKANIERVSMWFVA